MTPRPRRSGSHRLPAKAISSTFASILASPLALLTAIPIACVASAPGKAQVPFQRLEVSANAGDVKLVGDIDLDGTADVILGGSRGEDLNWYHYPDWSRTRIAIPAVEFTTDGAIGDLDRDGDLDLVVPDGPSGNNLLWFENPTRSPSGVRGNPFVAAQWQRHTVGAVGSWCKDVELADFDADGRIDIAARENGTLLVFFQDAAGWTARTIPTSALGNEGLASGDVDGDGAADLVVFAAWLRNPRGAAARTGTNWQQFAIASAGIDDDFKALVADVDRDGRNDVLFSSSENIADVLWFAHGGNPTGAWTRRTIATNVERAHTLQVADVDGDGDHDVVVGQMHTATNPQLRVFYNQGGSGTAWQTQVVDQQYGIHNGVVADLGGDGDVEIVGANWTGNPPLQYWNNTTPQNRQRLTVPELTAGTVATIFATNAHPNVPVCFCATARGVTTPYPIPSLGIDFALVDPVFLGVVLSGANGAAAHELPLPLGLGGLRIWLQTFELGRSSVVAERLIR